MKTTFNDVLSYIDKTINLDSQYVNTEFYKDMLIGISKFNKALNAIICFIDNGEFVHKAYIGDNSNVFSEKVLKKIKLKLKQGEKTFKMSICEFEYLVSSLTIRNAFFGIICFAKEENFTNEEVRITETLSSVHSYLIKDFELNNVFKMQLKLLQDSLIEKEIANKTVERQNRKLLENDRAKTSFLSNVSHELRTPLNAIMGFADALESQIFGKLNCKQAEYIKDIQVSSLHLLGVINGILDVSKIESGSIVLNLKEANINELISEVINITAPLAKAKEIKINTKLNFDSNIKVDIQKFQQILYNLLGNAIKYSHNSSEIIIKTSAENNKFRLEVKDFGIGIDKKYHNKIFKKFVQLDNTYTKSQSSTGLGLAITKELVRLHKGKIFVLSEQGKGSSFVVEINTMLK